MTRANSSRLRRARLVVPAAAALGLLGVVPGLGVAQASSRHPAAHNDGGCPKAESLVPGTTWHKHTLATGLVMSSGSTTDSNGVVSMHVLRINLADQNISLQPLMHSLAERSPLSTLAANRPRLVAATNTGYFDFRTGDPTQPLIANKVPEVMSSAHQAVVGIGTNGLAESGTVWWAALLTAGKHTHAVLSKNELDPPSGLAVYNSKWGSSPVPAHWGDEIRGVVNGVLTSVSQSRWGTALPSNGYLLVGHGQSASNWLSGIPLGTKISLASSVVTSAPKPFVQAYGVGLEVVQKPGVIRTGFGCDSIGTKQPARTEIGLSHGGRMVTIAIVADHRGTSTHGLDENQMSELMVQLGSSQAFAFDGSGSTELLARLGGTQPLTLENYPADGQERPMPVGLGVFSSPVKHKAKHKH